MSNKLKKRSEIEEKYKWDLTPLCKSDSEFYQKLEKCKEFLPKLKKFEGKLNNKNDIYKFLKIEEELSSIIEPLEMYSSLKSNECLSDETYNEMEEKLNLVLIEFSTETSFATSEFYQLSDELLDDLIHDKKFKDYDRTFSQIKKDKIHKLTKEEEKLISGMDFLGGFSENMRNLIDVDIDYGEVESSTGKKYHLTQSNYSKYMRSNDRVLRKNTFLKINGTFGKYISTLSSNYINEVKANCYFSKVRKYKNAITSALENEEIDPKVYDCLIESVHNNLSIIFDYYKIKQKEMKLKDFYIYDTMATNEKVEKKYTYDEAIEVLKKALLPLGEEYISLLDRAKNERWIDVYPNVNKCSGAFESGIYGYNPYVLANYENDLESVFTLAHELGHAMHSYYSFKNQPREKAYYPIFLAEIASTTNEILLVNYLLSQSKNNEEKKVLYNKLFDEVKGAIFRQTMFAEFEEKVHSLHEQGEGLTKDKLCNLYYDLNKQYFGFVKLVDEIKYEWARIPHFFTEFYVYKYATGMLSAICFANKILSGERDALKNYLRFLSSGCSEEPLKILKSCGCDLENPETMNECFNYLKKMLKEWKKIQD